MYNRMNTKPRTKKWKEDMSKKMTGRILTQEWKDKIGKANSIALKGHKNSEKNKEMARERWTGANNPRFNKDKELHKKIRKFCYQSVYRVLLKYGKDKPSKTYKLLGYNAKQLKISIEQKFKNGMNWENRSLWDIDHKKPISVFLKEGITDLSIINSLDNLQPMWRKENIKKGSRYLNNTTTVTNV